MTGLLRGGMSGIIRRRDANSAWYRAGGAPAPIRAYCPLGAANYAASLHDFAEIQDAFEGVTPGFSSATGWIFDGSSKRLRTGAIPANLDYTIIVRFAAVSGDNRYIFGSTNAAVTAAFVINEGNGGKRMWWRGSTILKNGTAVAAGVQALAGRSAYMDGALIATLTDAGITPNREFIIGGYGVGAAEGLMVGYWQAGAIYDTSTGHATWVPAVSAAMAALTG